MKSIGAVVAGFLTVVILSTATDFLLELLGIFPPIGQGFFITWMLIVAFIYRSVYTVLGGYITAKLAPDRPVRHAIILGIVGIVAGSIGVVVGWNLSAHWYPIAVVIGALPCTWLGGKLKTSKEPRPAIS
jgi:hypothetical protein